MRLYDNMHDEGRGRDKFVFVIVVQLAKILCAPVGKRRTLNVTGDTGVVVVVSANLFLVASQQILSDNIVILVSLQTVSIPIKSHS